MTCLDDQIDLCSANKQYLTCLIFSSKKTTSNLFIGHFRGPLGSFLVGSSNKKVKSACGTVISESQRLNFRLYCYYFLNFKAILCFDWSLHCTVFFCPKRQLLQLTNYEIRGLVVSQRGTNIHWSVPTSLLDQTINLYTLVVGFVYFCRLVEPTL